MPVDDKATSFILELTAHILHIDRRHTKAFHPDPLAMLPVVVNVIQHVMSEPISPEIDLPLGAVLLAFVDQEGALRGCERLAKHALSLATAGLLQVLFGGGGRVLGVDAPERGVDGGRAQAGPGAVEATGAERGVLGLAEPDGLGVRGALRVAEAEIEGEVGVGGRAVSAVQRRGRPVGGLLGPTLLVGAGACAVGDLFRGGGQGGRRHEAVAV